MVPLEILFLHFNVCSMKRKCKNVSTVVRQRKIFQHPSMNVNELVNESITDIMHAFARLGDGVYYFNHSSISIEGDFFYNLTLSRVPSHEGSEVNRSLLQEICTCKVFHRKFL